MATTKVKFIYNPYSLSETDFRLESGKVLKNVLPPYMKNKRLQEWLYPYEYGNEKWIGLIPKIAHEIGKNNFTIEFSGRKIDYLDILHAIDLCNGKHTVDVEYRQQGDTEEKLELLRCALNKLEESPIARIKAPLTKFAIDSMNGEFQVGVFGNMSAGKSTFINALIGKRVLASSTSECTTKLTKIYDDDTKDKFEIEYFDSEKQKKVKVEVDAVDNKALQLLNQSNAIDEICAYGNIPFVNGDICRLVLIDTPGTGTANSDNSDKAYCELGSLNSVKILLFDSSEIGNEIMLSVLDEVANEIKCSNSTSAENVFIVINKMDDLIDANDDPNDKIVEVKNHLSAAGIYNAKVFPCMSLCAFATKLQKSSDKLMPGEKTKYNNIISWVNDPDFQKYNLYNYRPNSRDGISSDKIRELDINEQALYFSGIKAIEEEIVRYIQKYAFPIKVECFYRKCFDLLNCEFEYDNWISMQESIISEDIKSENIVINQKNENEIIIANSEKALELKDLIARVESDNQIIVDGLKQYIQRNKKEILDEIFNGICSFEGGEETIGTVLWYILTIIGVLLPGGLITTGIGYFLGGAFGLTGISMEAYKKEEIAKKLKEGKTSLLKQEFTKAEEEINDNIIGVESKAHSLLSPLGMADSIPDCERIVFSDFNIQIDVKKLIKKTVKAFSYSKKINKDKLRIILDEQFEVFFQSAFKLFLEEYEVQSTKVIEQLSADAQKVSDILTRAKNHFDRASVSLEQIQEELEVVTKEVTWMKEFKNNIDAVIDMGE